MARGLLPAYFKDSRGTMIPVVLEVFARQPLDTPLSAHVCEGDPKQDAGGIQAKAR